MNLAVEMADVSKYRNAIFCAVLTVVLVALLSAAILTRSKLAVIAYDRAHGELSSAMSNTHKIVTERYEQGLSSATMLASSPVVVAATKALLEDTYEERSFSTENVLDAYLQPLIEKQGFAGYALIEQDHSVLASSTEVAISQNQDFSGQHDVFERAWNGIPSYSSPRFAPLSENASSSADAVSDIQSVFAVPIKGDKGRTLALLIVQFDVEKIVEPLVQLGRFRNSGETIIFNSDGRLITAPRFDLASNASKNKSEHSHGLLRFPEFKSDIAPDAGTVETIDDKRSALLHAENFVGMLRENQTEQNQAHLRSYVAYHGDRVLGVWYWDEGLGLGFSTEIFESEAIGRSVGVTLIVALLAIIMLYVLTLLLWILRRGDAQADKESSISEIVDTVSDSVLTVASDGKILSFNKCAEKKLGLSTDSIHDWKMSHMISSDGVVEGVDHTIRHLLDSKEDLDLLALNGSTIRCRAHSAAGGSFSAELTINRSMTEEPVQFTCVVRDITEKLAAEEEIQRLVYTDALTGLANRTELYRRLDVAIKVAKREDTAVSVMLLDIAKFKQINETFGHEVGDEILKAISARLLACGREVDTIARLGADEFVFVATGLKSSADAARPAERIVESLKTPIVIDNYAHQIEASAGISLFPQDDVSRSELLRKADVALYKAQQKGLGIVQLYNAELDEEVRARKMLENDLRRAVENEDLTLNYQPQLDVHGQLVGVEALLRWQRDDGVFVSPEDFVPIAENCGLISKIGDWVLEKACEQAKVWQNAGLPSLRMAVNMSALQFSDELILDKISKSLADSGLEPQYLELEITESMVMEDVSQAISKLESLREMGIALAIDDFGTGHSSLSYLKNMPVDRLKIDQSFIQAIPGDKGDEAILETIINLGQTLGLEIVAEGVETIAQLGLLKKLGCDLIQGYYFSKPLEIDDFDRWCAERAGSPVVDLQNKLK